MFSKLILLAAVFLICLPAAAAAERRPLAAGEPHIRATDSRLQALLQDGIQRSATIRALVARIEASNVIVYLETNTCELPNLAGCLRLLAGVNGLRYVTVRLVPLPFPIQELSILAHELQHVVEIAERPSIVDGPSLLRAFAEIGRVHGSAAQVAVDTRAAVEAGARVQRELQDSGESGDEQGRVAD